LDKVKYRRRREKNRKINEPNRKDNNKNTVHSPAITKALLTNSIPATSDYQSK
jgi:hypothetical protein